MMHFGVFVAVCAITLGPATIPVFSAQGGPVGIHGGAGRGYGGSSTGGLEGSRAVGRPSEVGRSSGTPLGKQTLGTGGKKTSAELLSQNTKLSGKLEGLLPPGTNLQEATAGFEHLGGFVSAVHVSHNLGIPFEQLKAELMAGKSLGQAIHELKPGVDAKKEAIKANEQALKDMKGSLQRSQARKTE